MTMIFLTIKWGDKYGPEYVNNLFKMVQKNYTGEWRFACFTDDPTDLECSEIYPIPDDGLLHPKYFENDGCFDRPKFLMFNAEEWLSCGSEDKFCYFDLDVVIQNNIDDIDILANKPRIVQCYWQDKKQLHDRFFIETRGTFYNSSMMLWSYGQCRHIYYDVYENDEIVFKTFFKGSDNYHYWRQRDFWKDIPKNWVYSWNRGRYHPGDLERFKFRDDAKICIFNTDNVPHPSAKDHVELINCKDKRIMELWNAS